MLDLNLYRERIGFTESLSPGLSEKLLYDIHQSHLLALAFENIDIFCGRAVSLEPSALWQKLVAGRRGGYCFELNSLLQLVLRELGFTVDAFLSRRLFERPQPGPQTHMILTVTLGQRRWLCDTGFGGLAFRTPIPFEPERVDSQMGGEFKIRADQNHGWVLQKKTTADWVDLYCFSEKPVYPGDIEMAHFFTSCHPSSNFKKRLMGARPTASGMVTLSDRKLSFTEGGIETMRTLESCDDLLSVLREFFGLVISDEIRVSLEQKF